MLLAVLQVSLGKKSTVGFCTAPSLNRWQTARYGLDRQIITAWS